MPHNPLPTPVFCEGRVHRSRNVCVTRTTDPRHTGASRAIFGYHVGLNFALIILLSILFKQNRRTLRWLLRRS